ncbi:MAG: fused MFS/spermidine synthase [Bacteroidetes bacterium]|nr:fused MFS/spermidine synthase [Bacteroidota bacterium]
MKPKSQSPSAPVIRKIPAQTLWYFYAVLVIEGASLMAVELIGAKLIAPFYGNSLYVWAAVLATTLGGLALGYFTGGWISTRFPSVKTLALIIGISALIVIVMPHTSYFIMDATLGLELRLGILISCIFFLTPPLFCFGLVGPLVVRLSTTDVRSVGKVAGTTYFISTAGGVVATFLYGFYFIPFIGLRMSSYITGAALGIMALTYFIILQRKSN